MPLELIGLIVALMGLAFLLGICHERRYVRKNMPDYWRWQILHKEKGWVGSPRPR